MHGELHVVVVVVALVFSTQNGLFISLSSFSSSYKVVTFAECKKKLIKPVGMMTEVLLSFICSITASVGVSPTEIDNVCFGGSFH